MIFSPSQILRNPIHYWQNIPNLHFIFFFNKTKMEQVICVALVTGMFWLGISDTCLWFTWCVWLHLVFEINDKLVGFAQGEHLHWEETTRNLGSVIQGNCDLLVKLLCQSVKISKKNIDKSCLSDVENGSSGIKTSYKGVLSSLKFIKMEQICKFHG